VLRVHKIFTVLTSIAVAIVFVAGLGLAQDENDGINRYEPYGLEDYIPVPSPEHAVSAMPQTENNDCAGLCKSKAGPGWTGMCSQVSNPLTQYDSKYFRPYSSLCKGGDCSDPCGPTISRNGECTCVYDQNPCDAICKGNVRDPRTLRELSYIGGTCSPKCSDYWMQDGTEDFFEDLLNSDIASLGFTTMPVGYGYDYGCFSGAAAGMPYYSQYSQPRNYQSSNEWACCCVGSNLGSQSAFGSVTIASCNKVKDKYLVSANFLWGGERATALVVETPGGQPAIFSKSMNKNTQTDTFFYTFDSRLKLLNGRVTLKYYILGENSYFNAPRFSPVQSYKYLGSGYTLVSGSKSVECTDVVNAFDRPTLQNAIAGNDIEELYVPLSIQQAMEEEGTPESPFERVVCFGDELPAEEIQAKIQTLTSNPNANVGGVEAMSIVDDIDYSGTGEKYEVSACIILLNEEKHVYGAEITPYYTNR